MQSQLQFASGRQAVRAPFGVGKAGTLLPSPYQGAYAAFKDVKYSRRAAESVTRAAPNTGSSRKRTARVCAAAPAAEKRE
jgi:hypothetical protein